MAVFRGPAGPGSITSRCTVRKKRESMRGSVIELMNNRGYGGFSMRTVVSCTLTKTLSTVWTSGYFQSEMGSSIRKSTGGRVLAPSKSGPSWAPGSERLIALSTSQCGSVRWAPKETGGCNESA
jgi:hypothetical protein